MPDVAPTMMIFCCINNNYESERYPTKLFKYIKSIVHFDFINLIMNGNPSIAPIPKSKKAFWPPKNPVE
jgi:hypothetical protein